MPSRICYENLYSLFQDRNKNKQVVSKGLIKKNLNIFWKDKVREKQNVYEVS